MADMRRVMIVGQPGSGKSTLAREIAARTHLPVIHIDRIHWQPGWVERSRDEKTRLTLEATARPAWIFEGGHSATWPQRLARADTLIWLDLPVDLRLWRVVKRYLRHGGRTRPDLPENCPERLDPDFLRFIWRTRHSSRAKMRALYDGAPTSKRRHHLTSRRDVAQFLTSLDAALAVGHLGIPHR